VIFGEAVVFPVVITSPSALLEYWPGNTPTPLCRGFSRGHHLRPFLHRLLAPSSALATSSAAAVVNSIAICAYCMWVWGEFVYML